MHTAHRSKTLTANATARLTSDEEIRVKLAAQNLGLTKSEWCRQTLLKALDIEFGTRLVLAEVLALRKIVLALQIDLLQDREPTEERLRAVIEQADLTKASLVDQRIQAFASWSRETMQ